VKGRLILVGILIASIILYSSPMMLTRVGAESNYDVTITWSCSTIYSGSLVPTGFFINVDGTNYSTPQIFSWAMGSTHNLTAYGYVYDGPHGYIYLYENWSDSGAQSHIYTVAGPDTVTANYNTYWAGDINLDHSVNVIDAIALSPAFGSHGPNYDYPGEPASPNWNVYCDLLHIGTINVLDAIILASNFGKIGP
jgi:hypothetical protein